MKTIITILISITFLEFNPLLIEQEEKYFVAFLATSDGVLGHAFVHLGYESPEKNMTVTDGAWGLYPAESGNAKAIVGEVPGKLKDDFLTSSDIQLIRVVSKAEYAQAKVVLETWRNKDYQLVANDCVSFVMEMATTLGIVVPDRKTIDLPTEYVEALKEANE